HGRGHVLTLVSQGVGDGGELLDGELLPPLLRADPGAYEGRLGRAGAPGPAGECGAEHLASLGEGSVDAGEHGAAVDVRPRRVAPVETNEPRVDVRHRPEDGPRDRPDEPDVGIPGRLDARHTVGL